jgi:AcrR family transcriptional regulator
VQRSRVRSIEQSRQIVSAARRLIEEQGEQWTTQDLAREAGVAVQTFYRYFGGKDQLLLAVIEDMLTQSSEQYALSGRKIKNPVGRLRYYVKAVFGPMNDNLAGARFITAQHWRLHQLFPAELAQATRPFTDLMADGIRSAQEAGLLAQTDPDWTAQFVTRLVMVEYHYYAFAQPDAGMAEIADRVWKFCLTGLGETARPAAKPAKRGARSA